MKRSKVALVIAQTVAVICPACGEPQPDPDNGSDVWEPDQLKKVSGTKRPCVSCGVEMYVHAHSKTPVNY